MSGQKTREKKGYRLPADVVGAAEEIAEERGISNTDVVERALRRGLSEMGATGFEFDAPDEDFWLKSMFAEVAKALAVFGVAFLVMTSLAPPIVLWYAAASLGGSALFLLGERHAEAVGAALGVPDEAPWRGGETDG